MVENKKTNDRASNRQYSNQQHGAALVELAVTMPLMLFIISVLLEFGNIFLYLTWISQSSFNLVSLGALTPEAAVPSAVEFRRQQIIYSKAIEEPNTRLSQMFGLTELDLSLSNRTVTITLETTISPLGNSTLVFPFNNSLTGPYLLNSAGLTGSLSDFQNPEAADMYGCAGPQYGGSASNCLINCTRVQWNPGAATCTS